MCVEGGNGGETAERLSDEFVPIFLQGVSACEFDEGGLGETLPQRGGIVVTGQHGAEYPQGFQLEFLLGGGTG